MTFATSLRDNVGRKLITQFGNSASLYSFSSATKTLDDEGEYRITSWGTATTIKIVDEASIANQLTQQIQGMESIGEDTKLVQDNVTISVNDRVTDVASISYRVVEVRKIYSQDTLVYQAVQLARVDNTVNW